MRWERVKVPEAAAAMEVMGGGAPGKRWGHTCNAIRGGRLLYVFGGYGKFNCHTNQVHVFDTVTKTWSHLSTKGTLPTPRDSHTCTTVGDNLYVFGGTDGSNPLNDLHILDTTSSTWISPSPRGDAPEAREGHGAALVGKQLFIFGGCGKSLDKTREVYYNNLYTLNIETFVWQRVKTSGTPPAARDSHTCSSWKNKLIVIGGEDEHDYYLCDVHVLDTDTLVWREMNTSGKLLLPRAGHSTVALGRYLFIFGGFSDAQNLYDDLCMLDVDTGVWTKIITTGDGPSARFSMSGDCLDPLVGGVLVFMGGCNKNLEALDDMYYLYTELVRDFERDVRRLENLSMKRQLKMRCQEQYAPTPTPAPAPAPVNDKALVAVDTDEHNTPMSTSVHNQQGQQYIYLNMYQPPTGKRTFQAKLMNSILGGYTIETIIDGYPLRGVLFSTKTSTETISNSISTRKRDDEKDGEHQVNGEKEAKPTSMAVHEAQPEVASASARMESAPSSSGQSHEVLDGNSNPSKKPRLSNQDGEADQAIDASSLAPKSNFTAVQNSVSSPMFQDGSS
ncbi:hypothetical protein Dimus_005058 [Dionaea muscipula]